MDTIVVRARPITLKRKRTDIRRPRTVDAASQAETAPDEDNPLGRKKRRFSAISPASKLPWKRLGRPIGSGVEDDGIMLMVEEVEGVDVVYEDDGRGGRKVSYEAQTPKSPVKAARSEKQTPKVASDPSGFNDFDGDALLTHWRNVSILGSIKRALHAANFNNPSEIQQQAIPPALSGRDVIGVAETGSGKTLAFGIPIINYVLSQAPHNEVDSVRPLSALVLAPTRELAMQVSNHLNDLASKLYEEGLRPSGPPRLSVGAIVGGIDTHKQLRIIQRGMDVMVATPGRLWDLLEQHDDMKKSLRTLRFLVLDEADRMIEAGHFAELEKIVGLTSREQHSSTDQDPEFSEVGVETESALSNETMQTLIFSATLSKDLQQNLKRRMKRAGRRSASSSSTLDELLSRLDFRDPYPVIIDLNPQGGLVATLQEGKVECITKDKDAYLYYFLLRYSGRSIVFLGSIDGIRRLVPILQHLQINAIPLHSQLEQKQRLKNLERFRASSNGVLIATDIAARGLDIPSVDHVVHYQVPRSADVYVHRSGRTARAKKAGFSLLLIGPDERKTLRLLLASLHRSADDIPELDLELDILDKLKDRVGLARRIDSIAHKQTKANHEKNWLKQAAADLDLEMDSQMSDERLEKADEREKAEADALRTQLKKLLSQPLVARGVMAKYVTSGVRPVVEDLVRGVGHSELLGLQKTTAHQNAVRVKDKKV